MHHKISTLYFGFFVSIKEQRGRILKYLLNIQNSVRQNSQNSRLLQGREKAGWCVYVAPSSLRYPTENLSLDYHRFHRTFVQFVSSDLGSKFANVFYKINIICPKYVFFRQL